MIKINESKITLKDLQDAVGNPNFMKDRASVHINNNKLVFVKLGKNKWEKETLSAHAISGIYTDQEVLDACNKSNDAKLCNESISLNEGKTVYLSSAEIRSLSESIDPFKDCTKVRNPEKYQGTPAGMVNDGYGNLYKIPTTGTSQSITKDGYKVRYNFKNGTIEVLDKNKVVYRISLSAGNWFDGPEYWVDKVLKEMESEAKI